MGASISLFRTSTHKFAGYERSLERIEKELQRFQARADALEHSKQRIRSTTLVLIIVSSVGCALYICQLKLGARSQTHWSHFVRVGAALIVPAGIFMVRQICEASIHLVSDFSRGQTARLEKQRCKILEGLKDATYYDQIFSIIEKYSPARSAIKRQVSAATEVGSVNMNALLSGSSQSPELKKAPGTISNLLQSTGNVLSPVMEKLAGMMEDDPMQAAAFRQMIWEQNALRQEVARLKACIADAGLNPDQMYGYMQGDVAAGSGEQYPATVSAPLLHERGARHD